MQKLVSFDLEIYNEIPEGETDWHAHRPLGISCAAAYWKHPTLRAYQNLSWFAGEDWSNQPMARPMTQVQCRQIVGDLMSMAEDGYIIVTVNGLAFDFDILAEESGMVAECADLAINHHCDMLFMSVCHYGWMVGLDALCAGAKVESKLHNVTLSTGETITDMSGAKAPQLWQAGEFDAVLAYLQQDVKSTLEVAETAVSQRLLYWHSRAGKPWSIYVPESGLPTVAECLEWPKPNTSWMDNPPTREGLMAWTAVT